MNLIFFMFGIVSLVIELILVIYFLKDILSFVTRTYKRYRRIQRYSMVVPGFLYTLAGVLATPVIIWSIVISSPRWEISEKKAEGLLYLLLISHSLIFTFWGKPLTRFFFKLFHNPRDFDEILRFFNKDWNYERLLMVLNTKLIIIYVYCITALAYMISRYENFTTTVLISAKWWTAYKEILVEVLLTYVAVDSVFTKWGEWRHEKVRRSYCSLKVTLD